MTCAFVSYNAWSMEQENESWQKEASRITMYATLKEFGKHNRLSTINGLIALMSGRLSPNSLPGSDVHILEKYSLVKKIKQTVIKKSWIFGSYYSEEEKATIIDPETLKDCLQNISFMKDILKIEYNCENEEKDQSNWDTVSMLSTAAVLRRLYEKVEVICSLNNFLNGTFESLDKLSPAAQYELNEYSIARTLYSNNKLVLINPDILKKTLSNQILMKQVFEK